MALTFVATEKKDLTPRITVFGVGGAGGNAVNNMIDQQLEGVDFVVANTDAQALQQSKAPSRIQLGVLATEGLGAGARPSVGAAAAEEALAEIMDHLAGAHMCFITAGMGGGTGTGAAPIIAQAAREMGVLTVGVVTKPFAFEGAKRMRQAEEGVEALQKVVDTLIIIPNQNLFRLANERTTATDAFSMADDVLYQGVKGVTDLMVRPGMINLDFADVRAVMDEMGKAMMGTGEATGEDRARVAAEKAIANPLLDEISLNGAKGVLINITGGHDLTLFELDEAANLIREKVDPDANIIVGSTLDTTMAGAIRVSVVATGIEAQSHTAEVPRRRMGEPLLAAVAAVVAEPAPQAYQEPAQAQPVQYEPEPYQPAYEPAAYEPPAYQQPAAPEPAPVRLEQRVYEQRSYEQPVQGQRRAAQPEPVRAQQPEPQHADTYARGGYTQPQAPVAEQPVQDDFFLDDVLGEEGRYPRRTVITRPAQPVSQNPVAGGETMQPTRRTPGMPTAEAQARLGHILAGTAPRQQQPVTRPVAPPPVQQAAAPQSRFGGLGSLITRMSGANPEPAPRTTRPQPPVQTYDDEGYQATSREQIEIPAFLRRQAN